MRVALASIDQTLTTLPHVFLPSARLLQTIRGFLLPPCLRLLLRNTRFMVDYAPPWGTLPRNSLHSSHDVPLEQVCVRIFFCVTHLLRSSVSLLLVVISVANVCLGLALFLFSTSSCSPRHALSESEAPHIRICLPV